MYGSPPCTTLLKRYSKQRVRRNAFKKKEKARKAILRRTYTRYVQIRRRDFEPQGGEQIERQGRRIVQATAPCCCVAAHKARDIMSARYLSIRRPSVAPCGAVPWVPSNEVWRGNGIGETPEEGGNLR